MPSNKKLFNSIHVLLWLKKGNNDASNHIWNVQLQKVQTFQFIKLNWFWFWPLQTCCIDLWGLCSYCSVNTGGCRTKEFRTGRRSSSESGEDSDEEDHADEGEGDQDEHQPQQPVDGLLGVLLQPLWLRLQLLKVHVCLTHRLAQSLGGKGQTTDDVNIEITITDYTRFHVEGFCVNCEYASYCSHVDRTSWNMWRQEENMLEKQKEKINRNTPANKYRLFRWW